MRSGRRSSAIKESIAMDKQKAEKEENSLKRKTYEKELRRL